MSDHPTTALCSSSADDVRLRGKSLPGELMGQVSFAGVLTFLVTGRMPDAAETALVDACLVTLMEHGLTPTAISARLTYTSAPEAMQGAVAAGLLSVGSLFVGTVAGFLASAALVLVLRAPPPRMMTTTISLSPRGLRLIRARERERERNARKFCEEDKEATPRLL